MVEPQIVILVVAGSSPVDHPIFYPVSDQAPGFAQRMEDLEKLLGYHFTSPELLREALTHPSLSYETQRVQPDNQRLEFLGDAVIQLMVTSALFRQHLQAPEGTLTKLRSSLVSRHAIASYARRLNLGDKLAMGKGLEATGGRESASSLADAFEAVIGAVFVDGGYAVAVEVLDRLLKATLAAVHADSVEFNPKGQLQEILQSKIPSAPIYRILREEGPDHSKRFVAEVSWQGHALGTGTGASKKNAEAEAARVALLNEFVLKLLEDRDLTLPQPTAPP
jgi:ribonuclease III